MKSSVVILTKNDNYGNNLSHRAKMCVNSLVENFDEVVIVDWKTRNRQTLLSTFLSEIPHVGKIKSIEVSDELLKEKYPHLHQYSHHNLHHQPYLKVVGKYFYQIPINVHLCLLLL